MTIIDTDKIIKLLNSDLTSYRVAQITNVKQPVYYRYQKHQTPLENMTLKVATELMKIINLEEKSMYTLKIEEEGKLQTVQGFGDFEDLKNHLINTDYFSWINDNEPEAELPDFTDVEDVEDINDILEDYDYSWWTAEVEEREITKDDLKEMQLNHSYSASSGDIEESDLEFMDDENNLYLIRNAKIHLNIDFEKAKNDDTPEFDLLEQYWDDPKNVIKAINEANSNDIEEVG